MTFLPEKVFEWLVVGPGFDSFISLRFHYNCCAYYLQGLLLLPRLELGALIFLHSGLSSHVFPRIVCSWFIFFFSLFVII